MGTQSQLLLTGYGWVGDMDAFYGMHCYHLSNTKVDLGSKSNWTMWPSSSVFAWGTTLTIGDGSSVDMASSSVFNATSVDKQPTLSVGKNAHLSLGNSSTVNLQEGGKLTIGDQAVCTLQMYAQLRTGPGGINMAPSSFVELGFASGLTVWGKPQQDSLTLANSSKLIIGPNSGVTVGNNSAVTYLQAYTVTLGKKSDLVFGDHMYCLISANVRIGDYQLVTISVGGENPTGITCFSSWVEFEKVKMHGNQ